MKRFLKVLLPILLSLAIIAGIGWYFFSYDQALTQDLLRSCGSFFAGKENMKAASWFYNLAYKQNYNQDAVAIEHADKYIQHGNYTKAEATLYKAIQDGAGFSVYTALSKAYIAQDKLFDAVELLDGITNPNLKQELEDMRPAAPTSPNEQKTYHQLISVTVEAGNNKLYVNPDGEYPSITQHAYQSPIPLSEGENVLYAIAVSDTGLVSPLSIFKYEISGVIETARGYEIIKCLNKFDREETDRNKLKIMEKRRAEVFGQEYDEFVKSLVGELNQELWDSIALESNQEVNTADFFEIYHEIFDAE